MTSPLETNTVSGQWRYYLAFQGLWFPYFKRRLFLGGLRVTNPPIRLMCPTSVCPSTFFVSGL